MSSLTTTYSRALVGMNTPLVSIETHLSKGLPSFTMVGLPETTVKESRDRVRSAILNSEFEFLPKRIIVNLAPADLPKESGRLDLAIAIGILVSSGQLRSDKLERYEFFGELSLSGALRPVLGILPIAMACKKTGRALIIPKENLDEAALVKDLTIYSASSLLEVFEHLSGAKSLPKMTPNKKVTSKHYSLDMKDVIGQTQARRALEIAAAGAHSLLMQGPPGTGKTMLASRLPSLLPEMTEEEAIESAAITSISSQGFKSLQWANRPFRSPHHSASSVALVGGGNPPKPGEISLAHHGVLFLDELTEFSRHVLESLREPLESGSVTISRAARQCQFPANFQLIAAMNPCPCGYLGDPDNTCKCSPDQIQRYHHKISGPLLDRIDLHIQVPRIPTTALTMYQTNETSEASYSIRERIEKSKQMQITRKQSINANLNQAQIKQYCSLNTEGRTLIEAAIKTLKLSARGYHKTLKVARTIADLDQSENIESKHLSEALGYRSKGLDFL
jgi:magnesium chelatase family protein